MVPTFVKFIKPRINLIYLNIAENWWTQNILYFLHIGYAIIQKVPESILGILVAVSAVVGVLGSVAYPLLKKYEFIFNILQ